MNGFFRDDYVIKDRAADFARAFTDFEARRRAEDDLPEDEREQRMVTYQRRTSHATDAHDSLQYRHEVLAEHFLLAMPDLKRLDGQRGFTHDQRIADGGECRGQLRCDRVKCDWDEWEADHKIPHSRGGPTTVENGQVLCIECNRAKGASESQTA